MKYLLDFMRENGDIAQGRLSNEKSGIFLNNLLRFMNIKSDVLAECCASHSEIATLYCSLDWFTEHGEYITAAQAAKKLGVSAPSVSRTLKNLEEKGLIERGFDKNDRRSVHIIVTKAGEDKVNTILGYIFEAMNIVLGEFSDDELDVMVDLHSKFVNSIEKAVSNERRTEC